MTLLLKRGRIFLFFITCNAAVLRLQLAVARKIACNLHALIAWRKFKTSIDTVSLERKGGEKNVTGGEEKKKKKICAKDHNGDPRNGSVLPAGHELQFSANHLSTAQCYTFTLF